MCSGTSGATCNLRAPSSGCLCSGLRQSGGPTQRCPQLPQPGNFPLSALGREKSKPVSPGGLRVQGGLERQVILGGPEKRARPGLRECAGVAARAHGPLREERTGTQGCSFISKTLLFQQKGTKAKKERSEINWQNVNLCGSIAVCYVTYSAIHLKYWST